MSQGALLMCVSAALWVVIEGLANFLEQSYSGYQIVWTRYAAHLVVLALVVGPLTGRRLLETKHPRAQVARGLLMLGMPTFLLLAVARQPSNDVYSIFWIAPLLALGFSQTLLAELVSIRGWSLAIAAFAGILLVLHPNSSILSWVTLLPLGMACCFSLYLVMTRGLRSDGPATNLFYTAAAVLGPLSFVQPFVWRTPTLHDLAIMAAIGTVGLLALLAMDRALDSASASSVAVFFYLQPVLTRLAELALPGAELHRSTLLGMVATVAALAVSLPPTVQILKRLKR
jgi:drug/metabolite transporter (DMT)-like permease